MNITDLSSTTLWSAHKGQPGFQAVEHHFYPAMEANYTHANRIFSHRTFLAPLTLHFAFEWMGNNDPDGPDYLGIVPAFVQNEEHGYYFTMRANGKLGISQEEVVYDGLQGGSHKIRPGDGKQHQIRVTVGDTLSITVDDENVIKVSQDESKFTPLQVGRVVLRLDRQHVRVSNFVVVEG